MAKVSKNKDVKETVEATEVTETAKAPDAADTAKTTEASKKAENTVKPKTKPVTVLSSPVFDESGNVTVVKTTIK